MKPVRVNFDRINKLAPLAQAGEGDALDQLLRAGYQLVQWRLQQTGLYLPTGGDAQDLRQEGMIGLMEAIEQWRPAINPNFCRFARLAVDRQMLTMVITANREQRRGQNEAHSLDRQAEGIGTLRMGGEAVEWHEYADLPDTSGMGVDPAQLVAGDEAADLLAGLTVGFSKLEDQVLHRCLLGEQPFMVAAKQLGKNRKSLDNATQRIRRKALARAEALAGSKILTPETRRLLLRTVAHQRALRKKLEVV